MTSSSGAVAVDFVGRYERLDVDFSHVADVIGLPPQLRLPRLQTAPGLDPAGYYTPATIDLVRQRYRRDVELFGYLPPGVQF